MLQYLINTSAIWLLSLVIFDVFLRRESFHSYNRVYLLCTFALGLILPLWQIHSISAQYSAIGQPVARQVTTAAQNLESSGAGSVMLNQSMLLWGLYLAGVAVGLVLLLKEAVQLMVTYRKGNRFKDGVWTIVETGERHSPYSAFRVVFISSTSDYTDQQLRAILTHEEQHGHLLHAFDLLIMQLAKIVFWFHPLVYMYAERLSIVHEYQADAAVEQTPAEYGHFLIEQSILSSAPALSHSFNRSPIKKRIVMLTRHSSTVSKSKMLIALPVLLVCVLCFTKNAFSDEQRTKRGNMVTYHGNTFEFKEWGNDTMTFQDPSTGKISIRIASREPSLVKVNGKKIYTSDDIKSTSKTSDELNAVSPYNGDNVKEYLLSNLKDELRQLKDGLYWMKVSNVVLNEEGKIIYFDYGGLDTKDRFAQEGNGETVQKITIGKSVQDIFAKKIAMLLNEAPAHEPALFQGKEVPFLIDDFNLMNNSFEVKNGKVIAL